MGLIRAILDGSKIVQEERDQAEAVGRAEGLAAERRILRLLLRKHLPELEILPEIDRISNVATLESIIEKVMDARDGEAVRDAILAAVKPN